MINGTCGKCGGSGTIAAFGHVVAGRCFACGGTGRLSVKLTAEAVRLSEAHNAKTAWVARFDGLTVGEIVTAWRRYSYEQIHAMLSYCPSGSNQLRAAKVLLEEMIG